VDEKLTNFKYDQLAATNLASELVQQIREMLKRGVEDVRIPRYKLMVQCVIGELKGQGLRIMSQCLWDDKLDNYADCTFIKVAVAHPGRLLLHRHGLGII